MHLTTVHICREEVLVLCPSLFFTYICGGIRQFLGFHRCQFSLSLEYSVKPSPLIQCPLLRECKGFFLKKNKPTLLSELWPFASSLHKTITAGVSPFQFLLQAAHLPFENLSMVSCPISHKTVRTGVQYFLSSWGSSLAQI